MALFYDHLVDWRGIEAELAAYITDLQHQAELTRLLDETLHHELMTIMLAVMPEHTHEKFLDGIVAAPHDPSHMQLVRQYHAEIEELLRYRVSEVRARFFDTVTAHVVQSK